MAEQVLASNCTVGSLIKFKTISNVDSSVYTGTVIGICDYPRARVYGDVAATHLSMEQGQALLGIDPLVDVTEQQFLIVQLATGDIVPYATEWLTTTTGTHGYVELVDVGGTFIIKLYNVSSSDAATAVNVLKDAGYVCKLVKQ